MGTLSGFLSKLVMHLILARLCLREVSKSRIESICNCKSPETVKNIFYHFPDTYFS